MNDTQAALLITVVSYFSPVLLLHMAVVGWLILLFGDDNDGVYILL